MQDLPQSGFTELPELEKQTKLETELDLRLFRAWEWLDDWDEEHDLDYMVKICRYAYAQGYVDALQEENSGELLLDAPGYVISNRKR